MTASGHNAPGQFRREEDGLGPREVPAEAYWAIDTLRATENLRAAGRPVRRELVRALAQVKRACVRANMEIGSLPADVGHAIASAAGEVAAGALADQFPVDAWQGRAGTSLNMNMNEVLANRALELLGRPRSEYTTVHPLAMVNLHQSTNDVVPSAVRIAVILEVRGLSQVLAELPGACQSGEERFASIAKTGRTELQDAVPITLGAECGAWAEAIGRDRWRVFKCEERLHAINLGGTAIGTGIGAPRSYYFLAAERLRELTGLGLTRAENPVDAAANADALVEVSGILTACASNLGKMANDLRLLNFLGELRLASVQAGSSIMPGNKVNPVLAEVAIQCGIRAQANHTVVAECAGWGTLQLCEFLPLAADAILETTSALHASARGLHRAVVTATADPAACARLLSRSVGLFAAVAVRIGYVAAERLTHDWARSGAVEVRLAERLGGTAVAAMLDPPAVLAPRRDGPAASGTIP